MAKIKVLMVDDEAQFRETTSRILNRQGYQTTVAASGEEALDVLRKTPHDVVVLDIRMPGMDGHEALGKIKSIDPQTQVIMLTGHGDLESAKESLEKNAFDYLSKPCDIERLAARIKDAYYTSHKTKREEKKARELMIPLEDYTVVEPDQSIQEGIKKLRESFQNMISTGKLMWTGHRSILVLDRGDLVGVLSIMDLIEALRPAYLSAPKPSMADSMQYSAMFWSGLFTTQARALGNKKVGDVMSVPPPAIDAEANLMEAADLLFTEESRRLVVKQKGKVVGVIREQEVFFEIANIILDI